MADWQSIESAPEFEDVLLLIPRYGVGHDMPVMAVGQRAGDGHWYSDSSCSEAYRLHGPTHWMPLPDGPLDSEKGE